MPPIQSITIIPDGVTIVTSTRGTLTLTRSQIPANVLSQPVAQVEAFVNAFLVSHVDSCQIVVHIFSLTPTLDWTYLCLNTGLPVPANWWVIGT